MFTYIIYGMAILGLLISWFKSKEKTKMALRKAWKSFENILPQFLAILMIIGLLLAILSPETIGKLMGSEAGIGGVFLALLIGSITLMPGFVAFPLAVALLNNGAGYMQIAAFISSLMMVGIITMPLEIKTFGKKAAIIRNAGALVFSFIVAIVIGGVFK